jgi:hypothetical protein
MELDPKWDSTFNLASKLILFFAGTSGAAIILWNVIRAARQRRRIRSSLLEAEAPVEPSSSHARRETVATAERGGEV